MEPSEIKVNNDISRDYDISVKGYEVNAPSVFFLFFLEKVTNLPVFIEVFILGC